MARPRVHLALALPVLLAPAPALDPLTRFAFLAGGVLVDGDHLVDYVLRHAVDGRWLLLPLHGWEWVALLGVGPWPAVLRRPAVAAGLGLALHLMVDQLTNKPVRRWHFSLAYRAAKGFNADHFPLREGDGQWIHQPWWRWF